LLMEDENIFAYTREDADSQLLVICNFYDKTVNCPLDAPDSSAKLLLSNYKDTDGTMVLRPYEARMYWKAK
ncbi:MAG: glucohydrolase, partial [Lachnospiraceae bacterium]|nr:glucohydrolase [Lachnospiraceae bacterium]